MNKQQSLWKQSLLWIFLIGAAQLAVILINSSFEQSSVKVDDNGYSYVEVSVDYGKTITDIVQELHIEACTQCPIEKYFFLPTSGPVQENVYFVNIPRNPTFDYMKKRPSNKQILQELGWVPARTEHLLFMYEQYPKLFEDNCYVATSTGLFYNRDFHYRVVFNVPITTESSYHEYSATISLGNHNGKPYATLDINGCQQGIAIMLALRQ